MKVFHKVTIASLKMNKTRTLVTIIGILLSTAMITAVTSFAGSFLMYARETTAYSEGSWHGYEWNTDLSTYRDLLNDERVEKAVYLQELGYAYADGCENEFKPYIFLLGATETTDEILPIHITEGRYPMNSGEILLPNHLYTNGGIKYALGDEITLELGERMLDGYPMHQNNPFYYYEEGVAVKNDEILNIREERTYTVVGFYNRMSTSIEKATAPGYTAITIRDEKISDDAEIDLYFLLKDAKQIEEFMSEKKLSGEINTDLMMFYGVYPMSGMVMMMYGLAAIVIGLIMFGSVALIYNAFSISISERTKQFGLFSSIGATKKQLRGMVFFEAFVVSLIGIPFGILAGILGIGVTLYFIGDKFRSMGFMADLHLHVSFEAIAIAAVLALITVLISAWIPSKRATKASAIEAIRQNTNLPKKRKGTRCKLVSSLCYQFFGISGFLAEKYFRFDRKKYRATILSLFMSIVLFISAQSFTEYTLETITAGFGSVGYDIFFSYVEEDFDSMTPEELLEETKNTTQITKAALVCGSRILISTRKENLTPEALRLLEMQSSENQSGDTCDLYVYPIFVDDASYLEFLKEERFSEEVFYGEKPLGIVIDGVFGYHSATEKYETIQFLETAECELNEKDGSSVFSIGAIAKNTPFFASERSDSIYIVYPMSAQEKVVMENEHVFSVYRYYCLSKDHTKTMESLQTLLKDRGFSIRNVRNLAEEEMTNRNIITIFQVFAYGFVILMSLIAAANVFHTISTNVQLRRREFAMLKSIGMTPKAFDRMMQFECLMYGLRSLMFGLPVSVGVTYLIYLAVSEGYQTGFHLPWRGMLITICGVFFIVGITMWYSMSKVKRENTMDALKNENI